MAQTISMNIYVIYVRVNTVMKVFNATLSILLTAMVAVMTYSIAAVCGCILAVGGAINWPLLKLIGYLNGPKTIQTKTH